MERTYDHLNLSELSAELQLMIQLLRTNGKAAEGNFLNIDWDKFIELALHHRVFPALYPITAKLKKGLVPEMVTQRLYNLFRKNTFQMLQLTNEMALVSDLFANEEINTLFLKGPVLSEDLYGDLSLRTSRDLDLLIPMQDLRKAEKLLVSRGYVKDDYFSSILDEWKWRHHHLTFVHPEKGITVEVHWRLNPGPGREPSFTELWERKRKSALTKDPVFYLGAEDLFIFLAEHGARHGWSRLRWLQDIHQLAKKQLNWAFIKKQQRRYQSTVACGQAIHLSSEIFSTHVSAEMKELITRRTNRAAHACMFYLINLVNLHTKPLPKIVSIYHSRYLFSLKSLAQKCLFLISFLYPYPIDADTLPLPGKLHFLYFPLRPFLLLWRKTTKQAIT
ncbi:nucleotidyltransferase family protein [Metabacillus sp. KIGAM252]|uniref:Nucleotidyltransferase family protein n=1 Tax=Metabacillus flavus TaxID=2823519 RepID=A0ABS5LFY0_9BACI|nr:nucleotidyltransferase family protein [Metabacillus flavus]MBS2969639.1 nucleotidyltransferase family protein [Metabacillus flavus]